MSLLLEGLALERLTREAVLVLHADLPAELERLQIAWSGMDNELAGILENPEFAPCTLEQPVSYFPGHRASAISEPKEAYPIITAMAYQLQPKPGDEVDQAYEGIATLFVEGFVKGDSQGVVNRRTQRTAEAINNVMVASTLNGTVSFVPMPDVVIGDSEDRPVGTDTDGRYEDGTGGVWYWQGFRLQYRVLTMHTVAARQVGRRVPPDGIDRHTVSIGG